MRFTSRTSFLWARSDGISALAREPAGSMGRWDYAVNSTFGMGGITMVLGADESTAPPSEASGENGDKLNVILQL